MGDSRRDYPGSIHREGFFENYLKDLYIIKEENYTRRRLWETLFPVKFEAFAIVAFQILHLEIKLKSMKFPLDR